MGDELWMVEAVVRALLAPAVALVPLIVGVQLVRALR